MVIGHQRILDFLKKSAAKKKIAHAYLFTGPASVGKKTVALEFMQMLNGPQAIEGVHPDVLIVEPIIEEKNDIKKELAIGIDQARQIRRQMSLSSHHSPYKIVLIDQAEKMTRQAANALLKTLEEPLGQAVLILITSNPQLLLATIVSRCQLVKFLPVPTFQIAKALPQASPKILRLAGGRPGLAINYLANSDLLKEQDEICHDLEKLIKADINQRYLYAEKLAKDISWARSVLNTWLLWFRDLILTKTDCQDLVIYSSTVKFGHNFSLKQLKNIIQSIRKTDGLLQNPSINSRLALEVLMLDI